MLEYLFPASEEKMQLRGVDSLLIDAGVNFKPIQEFTGHATIEETFSRYGHRYELPKRYRAGKTGANLELRPSLSGATLGSVNTREKAHELIDRLPDSEIETVVDFLSHRQQEMADALVRPGSRAPRIGLGRSTDGRSAAETATEPVARHPA